MESASLVCFLVKESASPPHTNRPQHARLESADQAGGARGQKRWAGVAWVVLKCGWRIQELGRPVPSQVQ